MEYEIKVIVPNAEAQMAFCNKLAMYRFHWMSEQKADEIPALLRLTGELGQILVLDLLERKIGIYPTKVYADRKKALEKIVGSCISIEKALDRISVEEDYRRLTSAEMSKLKKEFDEDDEPFYWSDKTENTIAYEIHKAVEEKGYYKEWCFSNGFIGFYYAFAYA